MPYIEWIEIKDDSELLQNTAMLVSDGKTALCYYNGFIPSAGKAELQFLNKITHYLIIPRAHE